jgi:hypothetical protein
LKYSRNGLVEFTVIPRRYARHVLAALPKHSSTGD